MMKKDELSALMSELHNDIDELGDRLEQYCGIYIDEEIKND